MAAAAAADIDDSIKRKRIGVSLKNSGQENLASDAALKSNAVSEPSSNFSNEEYR